LIAAAPIVATPCGSVPELIVDGVTGLVRGDAAAERFSTESTRRPTSTSSCRRQQREYVQ
jgi:hypothetical protein